MAGNPASYVEALRTFAERVFPTLEQHSYYQLLNVPPTADLPAVRGGVLPLAAQLHPDRFHALGDAEIRERLETIYARICEAYRVLANPERRAAYDQALAAGKKRLDMASRDSGGPKNPEDSLKHPEAKKFFRLGMVCLGKKDWKGAVMNFNFAHNFEPGRSGVGEAGRGPVRRRSRQGRRSQMSRHERNRAANDRRHRGARRRAAHRHRPRGSRAAAGWHARPLRAGRGGGPRGHGHRVPRARHASWDARWRSR